jgi:hypothetical protein
MIESSTEWNSCAATSTKDISTAGTTFRPRLSVACCIRVSSVITAPASTARKKERQEIPRCA